LNRVYAVLSDINTLIVRVRNREELFGEACRIAVEVGGFAMAWLGVVDKEAMQVMRVACNGADERYLQLIPLGLDEAKPGGQGLVGRAVRERKAMIVEDIAQDSRVSVQQKALEQGFLSLVILPLLVGDEAVGVLALHSNETGLFDEAEMRLLLELAGDIAHGLERSDAIGFDFAAFPGWRASQWIEDRARHTDLVVIDNPPHAETEAQIAVPETPPQPAPRVCRSLTIPTCIPR